jgi:predicted RNA binding protein YcfA (HicA-like mRNA interferase family)
VPKIPGIRQQDAVRVFEKLGFHIARQSGHVILTNGKTRLAIPRYNPIDAITMGGIAKAAGLTSQQFRDLL